MAGAGTQNSQVKPSALDFDEKKQNFNGFHTIEVGGFDCYFSRCFCTNTIFNFVVKFLPLTF